MLKTYFKNRRETRAPFSSWLSHRNTTERNWRQSDSQSNTQSRSRTDGNFQGTNSSHIQSHTENKSESNGIATSIQHGESKGTTLPVSVEVTEKV